MSLILVVDDEQPIRELVQTLLEMHGYEVVQAADGRAALALLRETSPDLLVTDIFMPEMEGLEMIQKVRALHPTLGIIAMSGGVPRGPGANYLKMAKAFGAMRMLEKPFTAAQLIAAVREALPAAGPG